MAYAAGKKRLIAKSARLGFHQYSFPGLKENDFRFQYEKDKQDWLARGFTKTFVNRAFSTPNNDMWKPTHRELLEAGFVTGYPESDEVAVSGFRLGGLENLDAEFTKIPLFSVLKTYEPQTYLNVLSEIRSGMQQGKSKAELRGKVFPLVQPVYKQRLPYASDSALFSFASLFVEQGEVLCSVDTNICYDYICGRDRGTKLDIAKYFSKELQEKEFVVMAEVIRSAAEENHQPPHEKEIEKQLAMIFESLSRRYGADVEILKDIERQGTDRTKACLLTLALFETILGLPEKESGPLLRFLFVNEE